MDIRFFIVGAPFIIAFFYTLFWLIKWGAFSSSIENGPKKTIRKNDQLDENFIIENIFFTKN